MQRGFSLVELSIVLVILGLLTGGILAGQSLIRAAELRAANTEYQRYNAAAQTFRDKYFALPGDMTNATSFWGKDNTYCPAHSGTALSTGTCNGNGDGFLANGGINTSTETLQYWRQLALAGLIEGSYTGIANASYGFGHTAGVNSPRSRLANGAWSAGYWDNATSLVFSGFRNDYRKFYTLGTSEGGYNDTPLLKAEEAWNIDTKMDDGKPGIGSIQTGYTLGDCTTAANDTDFNANYRLSNPNGNACAMLMKWM